MKGESKEQIQEWRVKTETLCMGGSSSKNMALSRKAAGISGSKTGVINLEQQKRKLEFETFLAELNLKQKQESKERIHAKKFPFEKGKMKLDLEYQRELFKTKQNTAD